MKKIKCPQCSGPSLWNESNESRPFCCNRCKLIDLGAWASEEYNIPASPSVDDYDDQPSLDGGITGSPFTSTMH